MGVPSLWCYSCLEFHVLYEVTIIPVTQGIMEVRENLEEVAEEVVS